VSQIVNQIGALTTDVVAPVESTELVTPFQLDSSGGFANTNEPEQIVLQHIKDLLFTVPGERVMRPNHGIGLQALMFGNANLGDFEALASALQLQLAAADGTYVVTNVTAAQGPRLGQYLLNVSFQIDSASQTHEAVFDFEGNLVGFS